MLLVLLFFWICIISVIVFILFIFTTYSNYCIIFLILFLFSSLVLIFTFCKYCKKYYCKNKNNLLSFKIYKCCNQTKRKYICNFKLENGYWVNTLDNSIKFDLKQFLFPKSFIISRVIREIRYDIVSNKLSLKKFYKFKLKGKKIENFQLNFYYKNKIKSYNIVNEFYTKQNLLVKIINIAKHPSTHFIKDRHYSIYKIDFINEEKFLNQNII